jgi:hypothetical protein
MNAEQWIRSRTPAAPAQLRDRMIDALDVRPDAAGQDIVDATAGAGLVLMQTILRGGDQSRATALDLLSADALITYACEAACENPDTLGERAAALAASVARLFDETSAGGGGS